MSIGLLWVFVIFIQTMIPQGVNTLLFHQPIISVLQSIDLKLFLKKL